MLFHISCYVNLKSHHDLTETLIGAIDTDMNEILECSKVFNSPEFYLIFQIALGNN